MAVADRRRAVGIALAVGSAYDLAFGVAILAFTRPSAALLGLTVPADPVYLHLNGILLLLLAAVYGVAAREPERYRAIAPIAGGGRLLGFAFLTWVWAHGHPPAFLALGLGDLGVGVATLVAWRRATVLSA
jgi:hypothetical protein